MSDADWLLVDPGELVDVTEVVMDPKLRDLERVEDYLTKVGDPHLFRVGDVVVKNTYVESGPTLNDQLRKYILSR